MDMLSGMPNGMLNGASFDMLDDIVERALLGDGLEDVGGEKHG